MEAVLDLGEERNVRRVGVDCLRAQGPWIFLPQWIDVAMSVDGESWVSLGRVDVPLENDPVRSAERIQIDAPGGVANAPVRYLRIRAKNLGPLPEWHPGAPEPAWLFVDEIVVEGD